MKKYFIFFIAVCISLQISAQNWININSANPKPAKVVLTSADISNSSFNVEVKGYYTNNVMTPQGQKIVINLDNSTPILEAGAPDIPKVTTSLIIPDNQSMSVTVTYSNYIEYQNIDIAPSKGNFTRDIDPSNIPYTFGPAYNQNQFYPGTLAELRDPYILRDFRGQTVITYPFQYNPVTKVLRVYNNISLNVHTTPGTAINPLIRTQALTKIEREFSNVYQSHFLNYYSNYKYTPLDEHGKMLIICDATFISAMQPFVNWKNDEGIPTEIVSVTDAGSTSTAIKTYVTNYYNTNGLTFLLLVGDVAQCPTFTVAGGGSDPTYGYIVGSDHYQEIFVGRFSAEIVADVSTQVTRTISYEKTPSTTPGKFNRCIGIGSDQGPGDDSEYDYQHQRNLQIDLMGFTYTSKVELFDGSQGTPDAAGNPTAAMLGNEINSGAGIITYCGHGADNAFGTTGFSNTDIANLTNNTILPFIWSVACVNGNFTAGTCFAEGWLRKTYNNQPAGAVATLMSTINQSWNPPMEGQDEMVKILTENTGANIKRTFGGLSVNGIFKMNDTYSDFDMTDTWTIFGDPSFMVRTDNPATMNVTHNNSVMLGETNLLVNCNVPNAFVCLTINHQIIGTGTISGGIANITFPALSTSDSILVTVTAFNYIPYQGKVAVIQELLAYNTQAFNLLDPQPTYNCVGISLQPRLVIKNMGLNNLTSLNTTFIFDGTPSTIIWNGNLPSFGADTVQFPSITLGLGSHNVIVYSSLPNGNPDAQTTNDTIKRTVQANNLTVTSSFTTDLTNSCSAPLTVIFTNNSQNATSYLWDFGDGSSSIDQNPTHQYTTLGVYDVALTAEAGVCGNDIQSKTNYITVGATPPAVHDTSSCGSASFILTAVGSGTIKWYDVETGGAPIEIGNTYTTPILSSTTTYYLTDSIAGANTFSGKTDSVGGGGMFTNTQVHYEIFTCSVPLVLKTVKIYANAAQTNKVITLQNSAGATLASATVNLVLGINTVTLNFSLPVEAGLRLVGPGSPGWYRNSAGFSYPIEIPGKLSITGSSAGTTLRYYYFYDWELMEQSCISARTPLTAFINNVAPTADFSFSTNNNIVTFTDLSSNTATYLWDFDDGNSSNQANPMHTYTLAGTYYVELTVYNGCGSNSISKDVVITSNGIAEESSLRNINIYPNPSSNQLVTISFENINSNVIIKVYNVIGSLVDKLDNINNSNGLININYSTSHLRPGVYFIEFNFANKKLVRKLVVSN